MTHSLRVALACAMSLAAADARAQPRTAEQPVVYGQDDRTEVAEVADERIRTLAQDSIVTIIPKPVIDVDGFSVRLNSRTLGESQGLCPGERFAEQDSAGVCSGTLIGPDLVLTAGHCFAAGQSSCGQLMAVFNYQWDGGLEAITPNDVFACSRLIVQAESTSGGRTRDYAIFQLDRVASQYTPANVAAGLPDLSPGDPFVLIGSPSGIPVKVDEGGVVRDPRRSSGDYLVGTPDTFGGNSGSGVFLPDSLDLFGVLISGDTDYEPDGSCYRVNTCSETGCEGENILYARNAIDAFCNEATDLALCGTGSVCGDGYCAWDEDVESCDRDCDAPTCGDGVCTVSEWAGCEADCTVQIPAEWTCNPEYYGTLDGCDCECGAPDPDCDLGQQVLNCGWGESCGPDGKCEEDLAALCGDCASTPRQQKTGALALVLILGAALIARRRVAA